MIEHRPWVGSDYEVGLEGQRIAIVAYSHHRSPTEPDTENFTRDTIGEVISGSLRGDALFSPVRNHFEFKEEDTGAFWNRVLFFNYLPDCIGTTEKRYDYGTEEQIARAKSRFQRIIREKRPHKVFVFTAKGWMTFPPTREEQTTNTLFSLGPDFPKFFWGTYDADGFVVMAFGLIHPMFAPGDLMRRAVKHILKMPLYDR